MPPSSSAPSSSSSYFDFLFAPLLLLFDFFNFQLAPWLSMALENLGVSYALNWIYDTFGPHGSRESTGYTSALDEIAQRTGTGTTGGKGTNSKKHAREASVPPEDDAPGTSECLLNCPVLSSHRVGMLAYIVVKNGHYPGLVNISGTYCFMNSVLQVCMRSLLSDSTYCWF